MESGRSKPFTLLADIGVNLDDGKEVVRFGKMGFRFRWVRLHERDAAALSFDPPREPRLEEGGIFGVFFRQIEVLSRRV